MKQSIYYTIALVIIMALTACNTGVDKQNLNQLNGYWEIKQVKDPEGRERQYKFSEVVDFIKIDSSFNGFRKKMKATLSGKYKTTPNVEHFEIKEKNDRLTFFYKTDMDHWQETLLELKKNQFTVENEEGKIYVYKRFKGFLNDE